MQFGCIKYGYTNPEKIVRELVTSPQRVVWLDFFVKKEIRTDIPLCRGNEVANSFLRACISDFDAPDLHKLHLFSSIMKVFEGVWGNFSQKVPPSPHPQKGNAAVRNGRSFFIDKSHSFLYNGR